MLFSNKLKILNLIFVLYGSIISNVFSSSKELIPGDFVDSYLKDYSDKQKELIEIDLCNITDLSYKDKILVESRPVYIATAGGPGSSKSTILENFIQNYPNAVYVDPDQRTLKFMINTYYQSLTCYEISRTPSYQDALKSAYIQWRAASNYIACTIFNSAFYENHSIAHGTTSTAKEISQLYDRLKEKNYIIKLILCGTSFQNSTDAIYNRSVVQGFVQNTDEDISIKRKMFLQRFPIYFQYADEIEIYWTDNFKNGNVKAAVFCANEKNMVILDQQAYDQFVNQYEQERLESQDLPSFTQLISN